MTEDKRVKKAIKWLQSQGIISSQKELGQKLGIENRSYLSQLVSSTNPSEKLINMLTKLSPELNRDWLLTGEGEMLNNFSHPTPRISYLHGIPYYNETFECGFDELISPNTENPEYLIQMPGYEKATLWCNASGHSMEPEINNGDVIALQRIKDFSFLPYGDVYGFVTTNGMRTIKRLGRSVRDGYYKLIPTNKEYDEQEIPIDKILMVYRVMGAMKAF